MTGNTVSDDACRLQLKAEFCLQTLDCRKLFSGRKTLTILVVNLRVEPIDIAACLSDSERFESHPDVETFSSP